MFAFKPSLVCFTLYLADEQAWLFCPKVRLLEKFRGTETLLLLDLAQNVLLEFIFGGGTIGNNFVSIFKMSVSKRCYSV